MSCTGNCRQGRECSCWPEDAYAPSMLGKRAFYIAGAISLGLWLAVTASVAWALA